MRIYIAGPYWSEDPQTRIENVNRAIGAGLTVFRKGHIPFIPHLFHFADAFAKEYKIPMTEDNYKRWDLEFLKICEGIVVLAESPGVLAEIAEAEKLKLWRFNSIGEIPEDSL